MAKEKEIMEETPEPKRMVRVILYSERANAAPRFVSVNGKTYRIPRNEEVFVPEEVAEVLRHSSEAKRFAESYQKSFEVKAER